MRLQNGILLLLVTIILTASFQKNSPYATAQTVLKSMLQQQQNVCTYDIIPSEPRNLVLIPTLDGKIEAKWWTPANKPCEVSYGVEIFTAGGGIGSKVGAFELKETKVTLSGLNRDMKYDVLVTARTAKGKSAPIQASTHHLNLNLPLQLNSPTFPVTSGNFGLSPATPADWKCSAEQTISMCPAAASRLCNPMNCAEVVKKGLCDAPFMRTTDWQARKVTQFCSKECGCKAQPTLRQSLAGPAPDACCSIQTGEYFVDENGRSTNGI